MSTDASSNSDSTGAPPPPPPPAAAAAADSAAAPDPAAERRAFLKAAARKAWADLRETGYAVVPGVLSPARVARLRAMFDEWYRGVPGLAEAHARTGSHGIFKHYEVGHAPFMWQMRVWVEDFWRELYGGPVTTAFDGCCYVPKAHAKRGRKWTHTDQRLSHGGFRCVQGLAALTTNARRTLVVRPGTHRFHADFAKTVTSARDRAKSFLRIPQCYLDRLEQEHGIRDVPVEVPAGAIALWDSRVFHCNQMGPPRCEERLVLYTCMMPRGAKANTDAQRRKRRLYLDTRRTTAHWAYPLRVVGKQPQTYGDASLAIDYAALPAQRQTVAREEMLRLVQ